jgi:hypothetical protein
MFTTFLFQVIIFGFIGLNILVLSRLFPIERSHKKKARPRKI